MDARLQAAAEKFGVEVFATIRAFGKDYPSEWRDPRLVAHDIVKALPPDEFTLHIYRGAWRWQIVSRGYGYQINGNSGLCDFVEAACELAERFTPAEKQT